MFPFFKGASFLEINFFYEQRLFVLSAPCHLAMWTACKEEIGVSSFRADNSSRKKNRINILKRIILKISMDI